jgi:hypothetical protein
MPTKYLTPRHDGDGTGLDYLAEKPIGTALALFSVVVALSLQGHET